MVLNLEHIASFLAGCGLEASVPRTRARVIAGHGVAASPELEAVLNTCLIERSHCGCSPTAAGKALLPHAESLMRVNARALSLSSPTHDMHWCQFQHRRLSPAAYVKSFMAKTGGQYRLKSLSIKIRPLPTNWKATKLISAIMEWWMIAPAILRAPGGRNNWW